MTDIIEPVEIEEVEQESQIEPPKKRRGRPPKIASLDEQPVNDTKPKRTYNKKDNKPTYDADSTKQLAKQLVGIHIMVASITKIDEIAISENEGMMLAASLQTMSAEYGLSLSGKTGAAIQLLGTAAMIYVPRALVINEKIKKARNNIVTVENAG